MNFFLSITSLLVRSNSKHIQCAGITMVPRQFYNLTYLSAYMVNFSIKEVQSGTRLMWLLTLPSQGQIFKKYPLYSMYYSSLTSPILQCKCIHTHSKHCLAFFHYSDIHKGLQHPTDSQSSLTTSP